jgi:hypothetical protein
VKGFIVLTAAMSWFNFMTAYVVSFYFDLDPKNFVLLGLVFYAASHLGRVVYDICRGRGR